MDSAASASKWRVRSRLTTRERYWCSRSQRTRSSVAMPRSMTTRGAARGVEGVKHRGEGVMFAHVAGEDLGAAHEAAGIEHQSQG